ncbi:MULTISPECIES: vWA domain-containing protein [Halomonadaceae]|uniref:vWA domain-containing protein n=1 Tax=Halomonadaceae TaxID=28256 RepID=UPI00159ABD93|nr:MULTISPECIES: vWA domain-containing protein [Halomonas]QJQ94931.1 hypothetical protein HIO72_06330 [Halomonas sp. PA5]
MMRVILAVGLSWLLLALAPLVAQAQAQAFQEPPSGDAPLLMIDRQADRDTVAEVRIIFDVSGSMRDNDPEQLGASALELLVALIPSGVHGGLWTFGVRVDNPLPVAPVDDAWREQALRLKPALVDYQPYTDIEAAVRQAGSRDDATTGEGQRHLIVMTDGMIDLPAAGQDKEARDAASRRTLTEQLAPALAEQGVVIHAVAFSPDADLALAEQLAQSTDGLASLAETPDALLRAFLDILQRIFPVDQVPLAEGRFDIDAQVDSFTALLFHEPDSPPLTLVAPDGTRYSRESRSGEVRRQSEPRFDLITVPSPQPGQWRIEGAIGSESRIGIASPLALRTGELPTTLYLGFALPLAAWLTEGDEMLEQEALPEDLRVQAELLGLPGNRQTATLLEPDGGRFVGVLPAPAQAGNARLVIEAASTAFQRQRVQAVNVLPAISAEVDDAQREVELRAEHPQLSVANTRLFAELQGEALNVATSGERRWRIELPTLPDETSVPLLLRAIVEFDGQEHELRLPRILLNAQANIGLDAALLEAPRLHAERLPSEPEPEVAEYTPPLADRVVNAINRLPRQAQALWQQAVPRLEQGARELGLDPQATSRWLVWALVALAFVVLLLGWRRRSQARHRSRRRRVPNV